VGISKFTIDRAAPSYIEELAKNMRMKDRREVTRQRPGMSLHEILSEAVDVSVFSRCGLVGGRVLAIWGLYVPHLLGDLGFPWAMTTDLMYENKRLVMNLTKFYTAKMQRITPTLVAHVDSNYLTALRWLSWAGFDTSESIEVNGYPFTLAIKEAA